MSESEESDVVMIREARLSRLTEAIALASMDEFDEAVDHLEGEHEDELGLVEEALRMFLGELRDAKERGQRAIDGLAATKRELEQKLATIERQEAAIRELSAPILEVWEGVLSIPVIGSLSPSRALDMSERLLRSVVRSRARWVLVDLTGVAEVDEATADHLLRLVSAVRLLGCRCVLTGIQPHVATSMTSTRAELGALRAARSLREGLMVCLKEASSGDR
jgi:rsbT co-antagonist protein RsbR